MPKLKSWRTRERYWAQQDHERRAALLQQQTEQNSNAESLLLDQDRGKSGCNYVKSKKERERDKVLAQRAKARRLRFPDEPQVPPTEAAFNIYYAQTTLDKPVAEGSISTQNSPPPVGASNNETTNTGNPGVTRKRKSKFGMSEKPRKWITFDETNTLILEPTTEASAWAGIEECYGITLKPEEPESIALRVKTRASPSRRRRVWPSKLKRTALPKNSTKKKKTTLKTSSQKSKNIKYGVMSPVVRLPAETHLHDFHGSGNRISSKKSGTRTELWKGKRHDLTEMELNGVCVHLKNRPKNKKTDKNASKNQSVSTMFPSEDPLFPVPVPEVGIPGETESIPCPTCEVRILGSLHHLQQHLQIHNQTLVPFPNQGSQNSNAIQSAANSDLVMKTEELNEPIAEPDSLVIQAEVPQPTTVKFICQKCGHGFRDSAALAIHCRTHSGIRPFPCELCDMHFREKAHREKHYKSKKHLKNSSSLNVTTIDNGRLSESQTTLHVLPLPAGAFHPHRLGNPPCQPKHEFWKSRQLNGPRVSFPGVVGVQGEKDPRALSYEHDNGVNSCLKSGNHTVFIYNYNYTNKPV